MPIPYGVIHALCEMLAYGLGLHFYQKARAKHPLHSEAPNAALWLFLGALAGGALGAKALFWLEYWDYLQQSQSLRAWMGGKTIVGGLLGGWLGVEIAKKRLGITQKTGDILLIPLTLGLSIGRIGCLLTGLDDHTYGRPTSLPWAWQFGDGVPRHPSPLYEIVFLVILAMVLQHAIRSYWRNHQEGAVFTLWLWCYLVFRLLGDFLKPPFGGSHSVLETTLAQATLYAGMTAIQWVSFVTSMLMLFFFLKTWLARRIHGKKSPLPIL